MITIEPSCIAPPWAGGSPCPGHPKPDTPVVPLPLPGPDDPEEIEE